MIYSHNVEAILSKYGVHPTVDYVSVDIDSWDLWVVDALLRSFRPRLLSLEYNPNIPYAYALTYPDASMMRAAKEDRVQRDGEYRFGCFYGASSRAIYLLSKAHGYQTIAVVTPLDVFLVPRELASRARRAVTAPSPLYQLAAWHRYVRTPLRFGQMLNAYRRSQWLSVEEAHEVIDFDEWLRLRAAGRSEADAAVGARRSALDQLAALGRDFAWNRCFKLMGRVNESHRTNIARATKVRSR